MNRCVFIGRLTKDLELTFLPGSGTAISRGTIAVDRKYKSNDGKKEADYINLTFWGKQAEAATNYTKKGSTVGVAGRLETGSYEKKDGTKVYTTILQVEEIQFLGGKGNSNTDTPSQHEDLQEVENDNSMPF